MHSTPFGCCDSSVRCGVGWSKLVGGRRSAAVLVVGVDLVPVPRGTKKLDLDHDGRRLSSGLADTDALKPVDLANQQSTTKVPGRRTEFPVDGQKG